MKRLASIFLAAIAAVLLALATTSAASICDNAPCEEVINVTAGENFTIELESNAGSTGFEWWNQFDAEYLSLVSSSELVRQCKAGMGWCARQKALCIQRQKARQHGCYHALAPALGEQHRRR